MLLFCLESHGSMVLCLPSFAGISLIILIVSDKTLKVTGDRDSTQTDLYN